MAKEKQTRSGVVGNFRCRICQRDRDARLKEIAQRVRKEMKCCYDGPGIARVAG
jgi:hypothetical protein